MLGSRGALALSLTIALIWTNLLARPDAASTGLTCSYVEAGRPGPRGNLLRVKGTGVLYRQGRVVEFNNQATCEGGTATVDNIDRVVVTNPHLVVINEQRGGTLAPGATREPQGSEIEIWIGPSHGSFSDSGRIFVIGTRGPDFISASNVRPGRLGLNLNAVADRAVPDVDVTFPPPYGLGIYGGPGADRLSAEDLLGFSFLGADQHLLTLLGNSGADHVLGSPGDDFLLRDGKGNDLVRGGPGEDNIWLDTGADTAYAGPQHDHIFNVSLTYGERDTADDQIFGGAGPDAIYVRNKLADTLDCGRGVDHIYGRDRVEEVHDDCEDRRGGRGDTFHPRALVGPHQ